jgi:hypothetical protein
VELFLPKKYLMQSCCRFKALKGSGHMFVCSLFLFPMCFTVLADRYSILYESGLEER